MGKPVSRPSFATKLLPPNLKFKPVLESRGGGGPKEREAACFLKKGGGRVVSGIFPVVEVISSSVSVRPRVASRFQFIGC